MAPAAAGAPSLATFQDILGTFHSLLIARSRSNGVRSLVGRIGRIRKIEGEHEQLGF
jgi:hypothetical protein